jgi:hypothetical protein
MTESTVLRTVAGRAGLACCACVFAAMLAACGGGSSQAPGQAMDLGTGITVMADGAVVVANDMPL